METIIILEKEEEKKYISGNENPMVLNLLPKRNGLLELFRYWNYVEYFFPYKYETDQNWNDVLTEMIPKFLMIDNDENFHRH